MGGVKINLFVLSIVAITLFIFNIAIAMFIRNYTLKKHKQTDQLEEALHQFHRLKNVHYISTVLTTAGISLIAFLMGREMELSIYILAVIPFIYIIVQLILSQMVYHKVYHIIRKTETTLREDVEMYVRMLGVMLIPSVLIILLRTYYIQQSGKQEGLFYALFFLIFLLFLMLYPYLIKKSLKAEPLESPQLQRMIFRLMEEQKVRNIEVFQFTARKTKQANAMIIGLFKKKVFFSDYLLDHLNDEEVCSILAHELGHYKKKHLLVKTVLVLGAIPLFTSLGYLMDELEWLFHIKIPIPVGVVFMLGSLLLYLGLVFLKLSKMQEYQADQFVLQIGISPEVYISALKKVAKLNHTVGSVNNLEELLGTHPSLENRIKKISQDL